MDSADVLKNRIESLKNLLTDEWNHDWRFGVRLPSGTQIDVWIPSEHVFADFKTEAPHVSHLYQIWMKAEELALCGVKGWEYQIWYEKKWYKEGLKMAEAMKLEAALNAADLLAAVVDKPDDMFTYRREKDTVILMRNLEKETPPAVKKRDKNPCRTCSYFEFCHL